MSACLYVPFFQMSDYAKEKPTDGEARQINTFTVRIAVTAD